MLQGEPTQNILLQNKYIANNIVLGFIPGIKHDSIFHLNEIILSFETLDDAAAMSGRGENKRIARILTFAYRNIAKNNNKQTKNPKQHNHFFILSQISMLSPFTLRLGNANCTLHVLHVANRD